MKTKKQKIQPKADQPLAEKNKKQKSESKDLKSTDTSSLQLQETSKVKIPTKEPETMEELLALMGTKYSGVKRGETIEGTVVSVSAREVLVDIGKKSYGIVAEWELEQVKDYAANLKIGDKVVAQVMNPENEIGYTVLSLRRSNYERRWNELTEAKAEGKDLEVTGLEIAKGGLLVDWQGLRGFIPFTQLEGSFAQNPINLINKKISVKIIEMDKAINRLVVSQKASAYGVTPSAQKAKLEKIKSGDVLKGVVSGIANFGVFIDVDGLEGLVHISEIAWEKVENPANLFKLDDKVDVYVLDVNKEEGKLNLSMKRLTPDPWKNILDLYPPDSVVKGEVVRIAPYGAFIRLQSGIEGLLHISKISDSEMPKIGEKLECMIEKIDPMKRKISLTFVPKAKPVGYR